MTVGTFKSSPQNTGTIDTDGTQSIAVGATLNVGIAQATGRYTGTFNVLISYN
jgi:hypothetical protein